MNVLSPSARQPGSSLPSRLLILYQKRTFLRRPKLFNVRINPNEDWQCVAETAPTASGLGADALKMLESLPSLDEFTPLLTVDRLEHDLLIRDKRENEGRYRHLLS
jgi:hypothetical protein